MKHWTQLCCRRTSRALLRTEAEAMSHRLSSDRDIDPFCNSFRQTSYISDDGLCDLYISKASPPRQDCRRDLARDDAPEHKRQAIDPSRTNKQNRCRRTETIQAKTKKTPHNMSTQNLKSLGHRSRASAETTTSVISSDFVSDPSPHHKTRRHGEMMSILASHPFECNPLLESVHSVRHRASTVHHV